MRIIFYETNESHVRFIDQEHIQQLGELAVEIGKNKMGEEKTVKVTLLFGSTQIYATATNSDGTEIKNCEFKFDCNNTSH